MANVQFSAVGRACLIAREGRKLTAYRDSVGVWTIGVGHSSAAGPPTVTAGLTITADECDRIFATDVLRFALPVLQAVKVPLEDHQADALVSFAFNIGVPGFLGSTVLKKLNAADYKGAADAFLMWSRPAEILSRRRAERDQFITPYSVSLPKARDTDVVSIRMPAGGNQAPVAPLPSQIPVPPVSAQPVAPVSVPSVKPVTLPAPSAWASFKSWLTGKPA